MKKNLNNLLICLLALAVLACGKKSENVKLIPKDAHAVVAIDVKSMGLKTMDFKKMFSMNFLKKDKTSKDSLADKIKNSGVDLLQTAYLFGNVSLENSQGYYAGVFSLSDAGKFEEMLKKDSKDMAITSEGDLKIAAKEGEKSVMGWNKNTAIIIGMDSGSTADIKAKLIALFSTKSEESLLETNQIFKDLQNEKSDMTVWMDFENLSKAAANLHPSAAGVKIKDSYMTATLNFENGQVVLDSKYYDNNEESKKYKEVFKDNVSADVISGVPGQTVIGMLSLAVDMKKLYTVLDSQQLLEEVKKNAEQSGIGLTADQLFDIFSGDFVASVNGVDMVDEKFLPDPDTMLVSDPNSAPMILTRKVPSPDFAFTAGISNKENLTKILDFMVKNGMAVQKDNNYVFMDKFTLTNKGNVAVLTTPSAFSDKVSASPEKLADDLSKTASDNSFSLYVNLSKVPAEAMSMAGLGQSYLEKSPIESISITGSKISQNISTGKIVIAMKKKDENSLVVLSQASDEMNGQ
jgi:hypothetical protein